MKSLLSTAAIMFALATTAQAGGYAAPIVPVATPAPVLAAPAAPGNWQGGYAGIALGYGFDGDDRIGQFDANDRFLGDLGNAEVQGGNVTLRAGYRWQRDRWVFGPQVSYMFGDVQDEYNLATGGKFESRVNSLLSLKMHAGYAASPDMLVYGIAGVQQGDFTYTNAGIDADYDQTGYVAGLGAERKLTDRWSLTGEWEYNRFKKQDVEIAPGIVSTATPTFSNVKLGLNFKF